MNDENITARIERLVNEEHELRQREERDNADPEALEQDAARLRQVEVDLDRSWDLLRQRRALRAAGVDPDHASARDADTLEDYLQ